MNTAELTSNLVEQESAPSGGSQAWRDSLGIIASVGCAIHCAAMPFVIAYLPALGLSFLADEAFHKWMALICFLIAIVAFIPGIRKHGNWIPVSVASVGIVIITFAAFGLAGECCASCSAAVSTADSSGSVVSDAVCTECDQCEPCQSTDAEQEELVVGTGAGNDFLATLAPWITPFGGVLLVSAHLLNRRYGYLCGCCGSDPVA